MTAQLGKLLADDPATWNRPQAAARELLVRRELVQVLGTLAAHDVHPLLLKGAALAYTLYPDPSLRERCDTDLLIREADIPAVRDALGPLGYLGALQCDGELVFRQFELHRTDEWGQVHALDFHWAISTQAPFASLLTYDELAARAVLVPALGPHARAPGTVDALLLALIHPVMHHRNQQRLVWVYDVHLLASALERSGWDEVVTRAVAKRISAVCAHGLSAARDRFGTDVPPDVLAALETSPFTEQPTAAYLAPGRTWAHETASTLRALGWRARLTLLREIALPSPAYMRRAYGVAGSPLGNLLLPVLYLHRGVRGVLRVVLGRK